MKKLASILAVTLAAGVLATGCGSSSGSASKDSSSDSGKTVIKAATGANAKPYVYVGDDDKPAGYDVDVLNAVFDKLPDYELEYEVTDFGSVLSGLNSGNYQIGVNNFSYNEDRGASYLYSYPYDKISYVFVTKKGGKEIKSFEDAAGLSFEGGTGISVSNAVEAWNEKNPDKAINITYSDADTSVFLQHVADGSQDFTIIDLAMYKFSYDRSSVRPVAKLCPYQMVSAFFYRIFSFSKSFCKMIWLADKISILIYFRYNFLRTYTDLSSIYYFIIKFCHYFFLRSYLSVLVILYNLYFLSI